MHSAQGLVSLDDAQESHRKGKHAVTSASCPNVRPLDANLIGLPQHTPPIYRGRKGLGNPSTLFFTERRMVGTQLTEV